MKRKRAREIELMNFIRLVKIVCDFSLCSSAVKDFEWCSIDQSNELKLDRERERAFVREICPKPAFMLSPISTRSLCKRPMYSAIHSIRFGWMIKIAVALNNRFEKCSLIFFLWCFCRIFPHFIFESSMWMQSNKRSFIRFSSN